MLPNAMLSLLSEMYGGWHSDSFITRDSGFFALVEPGDVVLSDKRFPAIKTTMAVVGTVLVMPPFNGESGQFTDADTDETLTIA